MQHYRINTFLALAVVAAIGGAARGEAIDEKLSRLEEKVAALSIDLGTDEHRHGDVFEHTLSKDDEHHHGAGPC